MSPEDLPTVHPLQGELFIGGLAWNGNHVGDPEPLPKPELVWLLNDIVTVEPENGMGI